MKYTAQGFQQERLIELGFDCVDVEILRFIVDFYKTGKMRLINIDGREYFWIKYKYIIREIPIIKIKTLRAINERLLKFVKAGLMIKYIDRELSGTMIYFSFVEGELYRLLSKGEPSEK